MNYQLKYSLAGNGLQVKGGLKWKIYKVYSGF